MKQLRLCLWAFVLAATVAMTGCKKDSPTEPPTPATPSLEVVGADNGFAFAYYDGEAKAKTFTVTASAPWRIEKNAGWFVAVPSSGDANVETVVTLSAVENDGEARTGEVRIIANAGTFLHPVAAEHTFTVTQTGYHSAEFVVNGVTNNAFEFPATENVPVEFTVENAFDWTVTVEGDTWFTVEPKTGKGGEATTVKITPSDNSTEDVREGKLTFKAADKDNPANAGEYMIELRQAGYFVVDTHEKGYVFYNCDFSWIKGIWLSSGSIHGYPVVDTGDFVDGVAAKNGGNGIRINDNNDLSADAMAVIAGYLADANTAYLRYDGYLILGKSGNMGYVTTQPFKDIDENCTATLLVSFRTQGYRTANVDFNSDIKTGNTTIPVEIIGGGTFEDGKTTREFDAEVFFNWYKHEFVVLNAMATTQIKFGSNESIKNRLFVDDIKVVRADDNAPKAADKALSPDPVVIEVSGAPETDMPIGGGEITTTRIYVNRPWKLTSDSEWVTFKKFAAYKTADGGAGIEYNTAKTEATSNGSALPFNNNIISVAANDGAPRVATLTLEVEGKMVGSMTIRQNGTAAGPFITPSTTNAVVDVAYQRTQVSGNDVYLPNYKITIDTNIDWTLTQEGDWFKVVAPEAEGSINYIAVTEGKANTTTEFYIATDIRKEGDFAARTGKITLTGEGATATINVSQSAVDMTPTLAAGADVYWIFSEEGLPTYSSLFARNNLFKANGQGTAYLQYFEGAGKEDPNGKFARMEGGTGHPYVTGAWPGDYWLFTVPTTALAAGTKINFTALSRTSGTGMLYWIMEYFNGSTWVPTSELKTVSLNGTDVQYNLEVKSKNINIDETVTLPAALPAGFVLQMRIRCAANWQANGKGALPAPNGGTMRFAGATAEDSPRIKIVE